MHINTFPKKIKIETTEYTLRLMDETDKDRILILAHNLSESDLSFMRRDITQPEIVDEWIRDIVQSRGITVLVEHNDSIVAYGTLYHNQRFWDRHMGEIRLLVSSQYRNRGLGMTVGRELMLLAKDLNLDKIITYIAADDQYAKRTIEELQFTAEALLADWVKTRDERTHDLLIMSTSLRDRVG